MTLSDVHTSIFLRFSQDYRVDVCPSHIFVVRIKWEFENCTTPLPENCPHFPIPFPFHSDFLHHLHYFPSLSPTPAFPQATVTLSICPKICHVLLNHHYFAPAGPFAIPMRAPPQKIFWKIPHLLRSNSLKAFWDSIEPYVNSSLLTSLFFFFQTCTVTLTMKRGYYNCLYKSLSSVESKIFKTFYFFFKWIYLLFLSSAWNIAGTQQTLERGKYA